MKLEITHSSDKTLVFVVRKLGLHQYQMSAPAAFTDLTMTFLRPSQAQLYAEGLADRSVRSLKLLSKKYREFETEVNSTAKSAGDRDAIKRVA